MNVSLRHLRAFVAVACTESFTAAARNLCLTQSTLTKTIRELEEEVGLALFVRTTRSVTLTPDGSIFLPGMQRLLNDLELSLADLKEQSAGRRGSLHVACGTAFSSTVLTEVLRRMRDRFPAIHVNLLDDSSAGVIRRIALGEVDIGFGSYVGAATNVLKIRKLLTAQLGVMFPPDVSIPDGLIGLETLWTMPLLRDKEDSSIMNVLGRHLPDLWQKVSSNFAIANLDTQFCLIRAGVGACILSALAASHPAARDLSYRLIDMPQLQRDVYVFTRNEVPLSPVATTFLQLVYEVLPEMTFCPGVQLTSSV
ncbi:LysR family transcriptional regulator [Chitinivorax sp. B]|uniref:LysR family transcriptional regulator n=1 Tax=Chitinivorax sp. B TaxID=2502235 RepID=UPI0010F9974D|nr:LysR family transcriptional regulator [Chitinivorax sp. B]